MATSETIGKTKKNSTDDLISNSINKQNNWLENRRTYSRRVLKEMNTYAKTTNNSENTAKESIGNRSNTGFKLKDYWFPILCVIVVIVITIFVLFGRIHCSNYNIISNNNTNTQSMKADIQTPSFDIVRIEEAGKIIIAGRWKANKKISIFMNNRIVATEATDSNGEFVYAPKHELKPGNYTVYLLGNNPQTKSENKVFLYVSERGSENSVSLLLKKDGSTVLQAPKSLQDGDLSVSKIDYLSDGRLIVTGDALPRLRVSLELNNKQLGWAHVSDYKHFGIGADIGELVAGKEYDLSVRMHDGDGNVIAKIIHHFTAPEMTGDDDTFYTVRRGDCLWIIARNFMRRGVLFSVIAQRNNIKNPDLIFPKQKLQIPVGK